MCSDRRSAAPSGQECPDVIGSRITPAYNPLSGPRSAVLRPLVRIVAIAPGLTACSVLMSSSLVEASRWQHPCIARSVLALKSRTCRTSRYFLRLNVHTRSTGVVLSLEWACRILELAGTQPIDARVAEQAAKRFAAELRPMAATERDTLSS